MPEIPPPGSFYLSSFMDAIVANSMPPILAGISSTGTILLIDLKTNGLQTIPPLVSSKPTAISDFKNGFLGLGFEDGSSALIKLYPQMVKILLDSCMP